VEQWLPGRCLLPFVVSDDARTEVEPVASYLRLLIVGDAGAPVVRYTGPLVRQSRSLGSRRAVRVCQTMMSTAEPFRVT
jgi:hypothetical protein